MKSLVKKVVFGALFLMNVGLVFAHPPVDPPAYGGVPPILIKTAIELHDRIEAELEKRRPEFERRKKEIETKYKNKKAEIMSNLNNEYKVGKEKIETEFENKLEKKEYKLRINLAYKQREEIEKIKSKYNEVHEAEVRSKRKDALSKLDAKFDTMRREEISKLKEEVKAEKNEAMLDFECNFTKHKDDTIASSKEKIESELKDELEELEAWYKDVELEWDDIRTYGNFKPMTFSTDIPQCVKDAFVYRYKNYNPENGSVIYDYSKEYKAFTRVSVIDMLGRGINCDRSSWEPGRNQVRHIAKSLLLLDKKTRNFIEEKQRGWKTDFAVIVDKNFNISYIDNVYEKFCSCMPRSSFLKGFSCAVD